MTINNNENIMNLVNQMCNTESTGCRSLNKSELARNLMNIANIPQNAIIQEIPLDWDDQIVVLFLIPNDDNYYSLFAGIGNDNNFYFELSITGKLQNDNTFNFYDEDEIININYFMTENINKVNNPNLAYLLKSENDYNEKEYREKLKSDWKIGIEKLENELRKLPNNAFDPLQD